MKKFRFCFTGDHNYLDCYLLESSINQLKEGLVNGGCVGGLSCKDQGDIIYINLNTVAYAYQID